MTERVGIVAVAQTKYEADKERQNFGEMVREVVDKVVAETGLKYEDQEPNDFAIDKIVSCSEDYWDCANISDIRTHAEMGGFAMDEIKVSADGAQAAFLATLNILAGHANVVLVVAHRKESITTASIIENAAFDPIYQRPLGLDFRSAAALQAQRYKDKYEINQEQWAKAVVRDRKNAQNNPYALGLPPLTTADVLDSRMLVYPLRLLDCKPPSDGACAMILAREDIAKKITDKPVWVTGMGNCYDAHYLGDRDLGDCDALVMAANRAYKMAGVSNPLKDIDVAEISADYSYQELLWMEGLGFCDRGKAGQLIDDGITEADGELPINLSGGTLAGSPGGVAGLARVADLVLQLRGEAGAGQAKSLKTGVAHGVTGQCGQSHCVIILGN
ncbi:thiolase family protein [Thermodesulfobacteriota bacterium]